MDRACVVASHDPEAAGYDHVAIPRGGIPIATILAWIDALPLFLEVVRRAPPPPVAGPIPVILRGG